MKQRMDELKTYNSSLRRENEALSLDVAFYNKDFTLPNQEGNK